MNKTFSTLPPLTRSPSPNRGGFSAGSRSSWRKGRLARCSRRDSPAPAPYPVRFVAANSAFSVFRFAKRRKPLCCRSSSPKVFRLSGSPLNHRRRFAGYAPQGGETVAERGFLSNLNCRRSGRQQIFNLPRRHDLFRFAAHPQPPRRGDGGVKTPPYSRTSGSLRQLADATYRGKICGGAAGAAVRSSAPSSVSMASCETHFARFCREPPPDGGAPFAGANARGRSPLSLAVTTVSFRRKRWG